MPIFLIGFMGAGKTTLGRALEARLPGWRFIDLDEEIECREGLSISRIFKNYGETVFRRMERDTLRDLLSSERTIIGCGGGTPCFFDNMEQMNRFGTTVYLVASRPVLLRRLLEAQNQRPKLAGLSPEALDQYIESSLADRDPYYSLAQSRFPSDRLESVAEVEATCRLFIRLFIPQNR